MKWRDQSDSSVDTFVPTERYRNARHEFFMNGVVGDFLDESGSPSLGRPVSILDAGGSSIYWIERGIADDERFEISVLNIDDEEFSKREPHPRITEIVGDATKLSESFAPASFDIVFSNSVIEHVGGLREQRSMADGVRAVGNAYYVQTPNRRFPLEPHFIDPIYLSPLCHPIMPQAVRVWAAGRTASGGDTEEETRAILASIRLMNKQELAASFPDASVEPERFFGLAKSWLVYRNKIPQSRGN
jgi:hypothetical protein